MTTIFSCRVFLIVTSSLIFLAFARVSISQAQSAKWSHVVCFQTYDRFVTSRTDLKDCTEKPTLRLYMPTAAKKDKNEVCFLETFESPDFNCNPNPGIRSYLLGGADIFPLVKSLKPTKTFASGREEPVDHVASQKEFVIKLRDPVNPKTFINALNNRITNLFRGANKNNNVPLLAFLGPAEDSNADEIKVRFSDSSPEQWLKLMEPTSVSPNKSKQTRQNPSGGDLSDLEQALNVLGVLRIAPAQYAELRNATTSWVIQSNKEGYRPLFTSQLRGQNQIIGLIDDFIDMRHCFFSDDNEIGANHRKLVRFEPSPPPTGDLHGTFVAGIAAGSPAQDPGDYSHGQAPEAKIAFDSIYSFSTKGTVSTTFSKVLARQYDAGARVFSNSWGASTNQGYSLWAHDLDSFAYNNSDTLVIFATRNEGSIGSPDNARNALAVGAASQAFSQNVKGRGADGPTLDSRRKPELLAPGCMIVSSAPSDSLTTRHDNTVTMESENCLTMEAPTEEPSDGSGETTCATSWAAPAVAGAAALIRQAMGSPSGTLVKAMLLNSTVDMTGVVGKSGEPYPNEKEGWGRMVLSNVIPLRQGDRNTLSSDVAKKDGLTPKPQPEAHTYWFRASQGKPVKVTLVWTDPAPAATERKTPVVNDLDLRIERLQCPSGQACWFLGNDFYKGFSPSRKKPSDAPPDPLNNVEQILIENPENAVYAVSVVGTRVHVSPQGYALVVSGKLESCANPDCR